jgi:hypothetical protein
LHEAPQPSHNGVALTGANCKHKAKASKSTLAKIVDFFMLGIKTAQFKVQLPFVFLIMSTN